MYLIFNKAIYLSLFVFISLLTWGAVCYKSFSSDSFFDDVKQEKRIQNSDVVVYENSLSSSSLKIKPSFNGLTDKFNVMVCNARPDGESKRDFMEFFFREENKTKSAVDGDKLYLSFKDGKCLLSQTPTSFYMQPFLRGSKINLKVYAKYLDVDGQEKESLDVFDVDIKKESFNENENFEFSLLKNAIWFGPEISLGFLRKQHETENLNKLMFSSKGICFIKQGDLLFYEDGKWNVVDGEDDIGNCSLAKIVDLKDRTMKIDIWLKGKKTKREIVLNKPFQDNSLRVGDSFLTDVCVRTKRQISCKIEGKRFVIKEGDLLYKKDKQWVLGTWEDFNDSKEIREFFVFDRLYEKKEANPPKKDLKKLKVFVGYLFNKDKTQMSKIEKTIKEDKNKKR